MAYTPPVGNVIVLDLTGAYTPPLGNDVDLDLGEVTTENSICIIVSTVLTA